MPATFPPPIRTNSENAFAHHTMSVRVPGIVRAISTLNPDYPASIHESLEMLAQSLEANAPIPILFNNTPGSDGWRDAFYAHAGQTWLNADWFYAEAYVYRLIIEATSWWTTKRDPFAPNKGRELKDATLWHNLDAALRLPNDDPRERLLELLWRDLWSNRMDLSLASASLHGVHGTSDDVLVDDRDAVVDHLLATGGHVHLILDNAGAELALDLALTDALLDGIAEQVALHVKVHPFFVSDATEHDVLDFLRLLAEERFNEFRGLADRLHNAMLDGRLTIRPHLLWNSPLFVFQFPSSFLKTFSDASLVIAKGDLNYRRFVGDALWEPTTPFTDVAAYFPAPLLMLRTLKSDPIVGLPVGVSERLNREDSLWRVNGRRGVIQSSSKFKDKSSK